MDYAMFFAGMLAMAFVGGLIVVLFIRPWIKPTRKGWESSQEVMAENYRLAAAQVKRQTAEEENGANEAAVTAEKTRARKIQAQTESDQAEIQRKATLKQNSIEAAIVVERTKTRLIEVKTANDKLEIERQAALRRAGIDPDAPPPPKPKTWIGKHKFWILFTLFWVGMAILSMLYDKGVIK